MAASQSGGRDVRGTAALTPAELRSLLRDCLALWEVAGRVVAGDGMVTIETTEGAFPVWPAAADLRPVRWFYQTPERAAGGRPPRAAPSIVALLAALRNAVGGAGGPRLRIGG